MRPVDEQAQPERVRLAHELLVLRQTLPQSLRVLARETHVSTSALSRYFTGQALPPVDFVERLCRLCRVDSGELRALLTAAVRARRRAAPTPALPGYVEGHRLVVAVVGPDRSVLRDPHVSRVVVAAAEACGSLGLGVSLQWLPTGASRELDSLGDDRGIRAVVFLNTTEGVSAALPRRLRGRVVSLGVGGPHLPMAGVDSLAGSRAVVQHLHASGRRRVVMITGPEWMPSANEPYEGYRQVMQAAGLQARTVAGDFSPRSGWLGARQALRRWPDTDAIFAVSDRVAIGALDALRRLGVDVPGDVSVAGFDDCPLAAVSAPPLTTATHPVERIARSATLTAIGGERADVFYPSVLVRRISA